MRMISSHLDPSLTITSNPQPFHTNLKVFLEKLTVTELAKIISRLILKPNVHYLVHKSPLLTLPRHMKLHPRVPFFKKNVILPSTLSSFNYSVSFVFPY